MRQHLLFWGYDQLVCKTFLKNLSLACTSAVWGAFEKASSVSRSKFVQSSFLKLMNVFFSDLITFMAVDMLMQMGRWSDERAVSVDQLQEGRIPAVAMETSGAVQVFAVIRVGTSSLRMLISLLSAIQSEIKVPLESGVSWVCHSSLCAMRSPKIR